MRAMPLRMGLVLASILTAGCAAVSVEAERPGWSLVFSDEFERPGAPDPALWTPELGYVRNEEAQYYTPRRENMRIENGAKKELKVELTDLVHPEDTIIVPQRYF